MKYSAYPVYKDSGVEWLGEIPEHWEVLSVRRLAAMIEQGWSPVAEDRLASEDEWGVIKLSAVSKGLFRPEEHKVLPKDVEANKCYEIKAGDFLLTRANTPDLVGDVCVVSSTRPNLMLCDLVYRVAVEDNRISRNYLCYWFLSPAGRYQATRDARGSSLSMVKVSQNSIRSWLVALPPLLEQQALASFLDRETAKIDALIAKKERLIELLQEKRTAIISHAVTKGLDSTAPLEDSRVEWLGKIPTHWQVKRIRAITESIQTGPFGSQLHSEEYVSGGIPVINPSHLKDGRIEPDWDCAVDKPTWQRLSRHELDEGDIIFARRGEMGRCALVTAAEAGWLCGTGSLRMRLKRDVAYPQFLNGILSTSGVRDWLLLESVGATMDNLNTTILARVPLSVPPFDEQVAIASYLNRETTKIDALITKICEGIKNSKNTVPP